MSAARRVISKFGGPAELAKLIGKGQSTVSYWIKTGVIPAKWHTVLLSIAESKSIDLSPSDFLHTAEDTSNNEVAIYIDKLPSATHWGDLTLGGMTIPCYRLDNDERVFSLKGVIVSLMNAEHGNLGEYLKVKALSTVLPRDLIPHDDGTIPALIKFDTGGDNFTKYATGMQVERFIDLCQAYTTALHFHISNSEFKLTEKQLDIAIRASSVLAASSKLGIVALVDEATGYQYDRMHDALQLKYKLYLEEEMRKWEPTFPDQLWIEFGRLTKWNGPVHSRPKYWGKLVMELVYGYLDKDVAKWLKEEAPKPTHGQNYHQWLSGQYGLKRLIEHIWMLIGMASACETMSELRAKMAEKFGRAPVQLTLYLPPQNPIPPALQNK